MKKPAFLLMTDTHLNKDNIELNKDVYQQAISIAKEKGLKEVWHLGDIFDSRKAQPLDVLNAFLEILNEFMIQGIQLNAIPGNHDKIDYESDDSYLDIYCTHKALKLWNEPAQKIHLPSKINLLIVPYYKESTVYEEKLNSIFPIKNKNLTFLFTHCAFNGAKNNDGTVVKEGVSNENLEGIKIFVGHYHERSGKYIGSAFQHDFGENIEKGFTLVFDDGSQEFIQAIFPKFITEYVDLDNTDIKKIKSLAKQYENSKEKVRFVLSGNQEQLKSFDDSTLQSLGINVKMKSKELAVGMEQAKNNEFISFSQNELLKEFEEFCLENDINDKETGINLLKQSLCQ